MAVQGFESLDVKLRAVDLGERLTASHLLRPRFRQF